MDELPVGSTVGYHDNANQFNVGVVSERQGRSHVICMEGGMNISRNRIDLQHCGIKHESQTQPVSYANSKHVTPPTPHNTNANF